MIQLSNPSLSNEIENVDARLSSVSLKDFVQVIKTASYKNISYKDKIQKIRENPKNKDILKKSLPFAMINGQLNGPRSDKNISKLTGYVYLDFDDKSNNEISLSQVKDKIKSLDFISAVWLSSSGKGFHAVAAYQQTPEINKDNLKHVINSIHKTIKEKTGLICDSKCNNPSRVAFLSYDPNIYFNDSISPITIYNIYSNNIKKNTPKKNTLYLYDTDDTCYTSCTSTEFQDVNRLSYEEFIDKYKGKHNLIHSSEFTQYEKDQYKDTSSRAIIYNPDYISIQNLKKFVKVGDKTVVQYEKFKSGSRHNSHLYRTTLRRVINPQVSAETLLYCAVHDQLYLFEEWDEFKQDIFNTIRHVMSLSKSSLELVRKDFTQKTKSMVNPNCKLERLSNPAGECAIEKSKRIDNVIRKYCTNGYLSDKRLVAINLECMRLNLISSSLKKRSVVKRLNSMGFNQKDCKVVYIKNKILKEIDYTTTQSKNAKKIGISVKTLIKYLRELNINWKLSRKPKLKQDIKIEPIYIHKDYQSFTKDMEIDAMSNIKIKT